MFCTPSPSSGRGDVVLQPNYFTSSIYVQALRDDFSTLVLRYHEAYHNLEASTPGKPFAIFKTVWLKMGWKWLHFKIFDARSRQTFLDVTLRILLERTVKTEAPFTRIVALFAFYTFFYTQIKDALPPLHSVTHVPIPDDHYASLTTMPEALTFPDLLTFEPHVRYILSRLKQDNIFLILPKASLGSMNPSSLPREIFAEDGIVFHDPNQKRKGRPSKRDKNKRARLALDQLGDLLDRETLSTDSSSPEDLDLSDYQKLKSTLIEGGLSTDALERASGQVLERLKEAQVLATTIPSGESEGVQRVQKAMAEKDLGLLGLI